MDIFKLKSPCVDCPFRKDGGVRHGEKMARSYAEYFLHDLGATFPCHRSVPEGVSRETWGPWQPGQQMCAGGLILSKKTGEESLTLLAFRLAGWFDPTTLCAEDSVFDSLEAMVAAHRSARK